MNAIRTTLLLAAAALLASAPRPARAADAASNPDRCYACHVDVDAPGKSFEHDIHFTRGVSCAGCHGGDSTSDDQDAAMSASHGFRGKFKKSDIPAVCGQCHGGKDTPWRHRFGLTDVADSLSASVHGEALRASEKGPQCVSCHGVHDIAAVSDPRSPVHPTRVVKTCAGCHGDARYMREFNPRLPVDQYEKYLTSEHGRRNAAGDPRPATCVSCHSNHQILRVKDPRSPVYATHVPATCAHCHANARYMAGYHIPTDQYAKYRRSRHGIALLEKSDLNAPACNSCHGNHGAMPPGSANVVAVCGNCHQANAELFQKSAHRAVFEKAGLPGCVICHGNHGIASATDSLVSLAPPSPCASCHRDDASDSKAGEIRHLRALLDSLGTGQDTALAIIDKAEELGMDVSDARYSIKDAHQAQVQSRVAIHSFRVADLGEVARPGIAVISAARKSGKDAIHEFYFRRQGLAISTLIVTIVAVLLYLKIKDIEKEAGKS